MPANGRSVCLAIFFLLLALLISAQPGLTLFFRDMNAAGFNGGTFQDTIYNSSIGAVALNWSDATNKTYASTGNFTSRIFDAGSIVEWSNISWSPAAPYGMPLPSGQRDEPAAGVDGGANMSGNVLLLNFDEPDGSTTFEDLSGTGNDASCGSTANCPKRNDSGVLNGSLSFNVTNSSIMVNYTGATDVGALSMEAWVRLDNITLTSVASTGVFTCALLTNGTAYCWGNNGYGQLGDATTTQRANATAVAGGYNFTKLATSGVSRTTCGVTTDRKLYCWGLNSRGQLGIQTRSTTAATSYFTVPALVMLASGVLDVSTGTHTCALLNTSQVVCWGENTWGALGNAASETALTPKRIWLNLTQITGHYHNCGLNASGSAWCWGLNDYGELGIGTSGACTESEYPAMVAGGLSFSKLSSTSSATPSALSN